MEKTSSPKTRHPRKMSLKTETDFERVCDVCNENNKPFLMCCECMSFFCYKCVSYVLKVSREKKRLHCFQCKKYSLIIPEFFEEN